MKVIDIIKLCEFIDYGVFDQEYNEIKIDKENIDSIYDKNVERLEASGDKVMIFTFDNIAASYKDKIELWESNNNETMKLAISSMLDKIEKELNIQYWNKNQKELISPFKNTGTNFETDFFKVRAYNWDFDSENLPNFETEFLKVWWYKHSNRELEYKFKYGYESYTTLAYILANSLKSIDKYFKEND